MEGICLMPMVFCGVSVTKLFDDDEIFKFRYLSFLWLVQMTCIPSNWCFISTSRSTYNVSCLYPCFIHSCNCCFTSWLVSVFARQLDFLGNFQTLDKLGCFFFIEICSTMLYFLLIKFLKDAATMHPISSEALKNTFWMHSWGTYFLIVAVHTFFLLQLLLWVLHWISKQGIIMKIIIYILRKVSVK